jgi:hypothetical protein
VVTTRRRVARRPAGPPSGSLAVAEPSTASVDGTGQASDATVPSDGHASDPSHDGLNGAGQGVDPAPEQESRAHVPVKKKGSRKR